MTRMTAMTTIMQDRLQERSNDEKTKTSLDYIVRLTDRLRLLLLALILFCWLLDVGQTCICLWYGNVMNYKHAMDTVYLFEVAST